MNDLEKTIRVNMLIDFYSPLLTEKQVLYLELYYKEDLSLAEIATDFDISRNAVHDNIQRTIKQLENYEEKLQLIEKYQKRTAIYDKIKKEYPNLEWITELENLE